MSPTKHRRAVLYLRLSQTSEQSVSIDRQRKAATAYAEGKGWTVVGEFVDNGVSASKNAPEDRDGWRAMTACADTWDVVLVWKLDRAVRRIVHFWDTHRWLDERGKALVSVEDNLDMTTTIGQMVAGLLAGFAQMEAEAISARVTGARNYLLNEGRYAGGAVLYGYKPVPNPAGKGYIIVQDPDRIGYVREMAKRTKAGLSIYSTTQWLNEVGAPTFTQTRAERKRKDDNDATESKPVKVADQWSYNTVERILRHPLLAGMVPHNPGHTDAYRRRGDNVVRGKDGLPVVDPALAVMSVGEWLAMVKRMDEPNGDNRKMPRALRKETSGALSGLVFCGETEIAKKGERHKPHPANTRMWRGTTQGRPSYSCPACYQTFSGFEELVVEQFLATVGGLFRMTSVEEVVEGGSDVAQQAAVRIGELGQELVNAKGEHVAEVLEELARLKEIQAEAEAQPPRLVLREVASTQTYAEDWENATDDEVRREILGSAIDRVVVTRGGQGAWSRAAKLARMRIEWQPAGQVEPPTDEELAAWAE